MSTPSRRDQANAIRFLSIDAVQKANSGHPGMPMGMADIAQVLWQDFLKHNPSNPNWPDRDRFILSNGHGGMLHYALLHLAGYDVTIEDLKNFRQLHSKTPGHPEVGETPGIETTTGPLGQGMANAVGMAIAEAHLAAEFNRPGFNIVDHYTYAFGGDGCLMEGLSHEAASLAGVLGLGKLVYFYDDNGISIDGDVTAWYRDNTPMRFESYGWQVIPNIDGHDSDALMRAIKEAHAEKNRPTIICCKTTIGFGSPNLAGTAATHGAPLGEKEVAATRESLDWDHEPFVVGKEMYEVWDARKRGTTAEQKWNDLFAAYQKQHPELAAEFSRRMSGKLPNDWAKKAEQFIKDTNAKKQSVATRKASQFCLDAYANYLPEIMGGSADLTESNCTNWKDMTLFTHENPAGRYIHYGVREFGMSAIMNGMALHKGVIPFGGTFLTFSDYARNAIRLAALMRQKVIFVYTHDSIGLGEDGPTHQPVEQLPGLRMMPNLSNWRPCDTVESAVAWRFAIEYNGPTCLLFSRQAVPFQERTDAQIAQIQRGAYVLFQADANSHPDAILIATGSEVSLAMDAAKKLQQEEINVRVVSMPSTDVFLAQDEKYREDVLPSTAMARVAVEAAAADYWYRFVGLQGRIIGMNRFGASAPAKDVFRDCGFTVENVINAVKEVICTSADSAHHFQPKCASGELN